MITLSSLIYYPIKACRGLEVDSSHVERMGLEHDRRMMVVTPEGQFLTQRELPRLALVTPKLEDGTLTLCAPGFDSIQLAVQSTGTPWFVNIWKSEGVHAIDQGDEAAQWFSDWLGASVRLVRIADAYPILLTSEESLSDLNSRLEAPVPMNRFRPNIVVKGCEPFAEDTWKRIRIGNVELAVVKPCARCVVTTIDKETLEQGKEPLKTLGRYRRHELGAIFGQNVISLNEGSVRLGMNVEVLS